MTRLDHEKAVVVDAVRQPGERTDVLEKSLVPANPKRRGNPNWKRKEPELATV